MVKQTEIASIPKGWQQKNVGEVFKFLKTYAFSRSQLDAVKLNSRDIFNIHYGDIHAQFDSNILDLSKVKSLPKLTAQKDFKEGDDFLKNGDLILADASEDYKGLCECVELTNISNFKIISGLHTFALRCTKQNIAEGFKPYLFKHSDVKKRICQIATGISVLGVSKSNLSKLTLIIPTFDEQQKIASILKDWDFAIETTQNLIDKLKIRKKGLCQQLLTGKKRLKGFSDEWSEITLGDIAERITDKNEELDDTVVTISAQRGFVKQEDFFNKRVASSTLSGYYLIKRGNFAYNKSYSSGYPMGAFKRLDDFDKAVVTTLYICFSVKDNIDSDFLLNYFEAGLMVKNLMRIAQEGGRAHGLLNIGLKDFFDLKLIIPTLEEQKAIANVLNQSDKEIECQEAYLKHLQLQKKGLMQQLLTGKIRVKV